MIVFLMIDFAEVNVRCGSEALLAMLAMKTRVGGVSACYHLQGFTAPDPTWSCFCGAVIVT
jgi:hypothetical protein